MASSNSMKPADRQAIVKKLTTELKKHYRAPAAKQSRSVLETLLFAACLENVGLDAAESAFQRLLDKFFDLNEIRVSSVSEIEQALGDLHDAAWKALRIREALQYTFEKHFSFDLDPLRRKTQDLAIKELNAIAHQTSFIRGYVLQACLGAHLVPIDDRMAQALKFLGLADRGQSNEVIAEDLKNAVKKADGPLLFALLKQLSVDPQYLEILSSGPVEGETFSPLVAHKRLADLFAGKLKKSQPVKATKSAKAAPASAMGKTVTGKNASGKSATGKADGGKSITGKSDEVQIVSGKTVSRKKPAPPATTGGNRDAVKGKKTSASSAAVKKVTKKKPPTPVKNKTKRPR